MCFEEVVKRITSKLKGIAHKLNGHFSFFNEEDLYQEALIHLFQDYHRGKLNGKTDSYILQGCYFYLKNYIRKAQDKFNSVSLNALMDEEGNDLEEILCLENPESCFADLEDKILIEQIQNNGLTQREKEIFYLSLEGLTIREIGKKLGISHVMVLKIKKLLRRKLEFLKKEMEGISFYK